MGRKVRGRETVSHVTQLGLKSIADHKQQRDRQPEHGGLERARETLAQQGQNERGDEHGERDLDHERCDIGGSPRRHDGAVALGDEQEQDRGKDRKQHPEEATHGLVLRS